MAEADHTTLEVWQDIPGFSGYQISDWPRVRSFWKVKGIEPRRGGGKAVLCDVPRILTIHTNPRGYHYVRIKNSNGKSCNQQIHRLVLLTFVGPCPEGHEGCHKDGTRTNNRLDNLYWGTRKDNCQDTVRHGRVGLSKLSPEDIAEAIRLRQQGWTQVAIAAKFGIRQCSLSRLFLNRGIRTYRERRPRVILP